MHGFTQPGFIVVELRVIYILYQHIRLSECKSFCFSNLYQHILLSTSLECLLKAGPPNINLTTEVFHGVSQQHSSCQHGQTSPCNLSSDHIPLDDVAVQVDGANPSCLVLVIVIVDDDDVRCRVARGVCPGEEPAGRTSATATTGTPAGGGRPRRRD